MIILINTVMRAFDLFESKRTNLLVVDVQPSYSGIYDGSENPVFEDIIRFAEERTGRVVAMYNDEEVSGDNLEGVQQYWYDSGASEDLVWEKIEWIEKQYAFFRGWMDTGIDDSIILKTIRAMIQLGIHDSRELTVDQFKDAVGKENALKIIKHYENLGVLIRDDNDNIYLPEVLPVFDGNERDYMTPVKLIKFLRDLSPFYMVGGGRSECLREIELLCNAFNIRYRRIDELIYG